MLRYLGMYCGVPFLQRMTKRRMCYALLNYLQDIQFRQLPDVSPPLQSSTHRHVRPRRRINHGEVIQDAAVNRTPCDRRSCYASAKIIVRTTLGTWTSAGLGPGGNLSPVRLNSYVIKWGFMWLVPGQGCV